MAAKVGSVMTFAVGGNHVTGTVRYIGPLAEDVTGGTWLGVELSEPIGRHSGRRYFACAERHGLFVRASALLGRGFYACAADTASTAMALACACAARDAWCRSDPARRPRRSAWSLHEQ
jgi:hypothetical protein